LLTDSYSKFKLKLGDRDKRTMEARQRLAKLYCMSSGRSQTWPSIIGSIAAPGISPRAALNGDQVKTINHFQFRGPINAAITGVVGMPFRPSPIT
jgi:hypothetical protein